MTNKPKKYTTVLADPPWDIQQKGNYGAINHYNLMTLDQIKQMPINDLTTDCILQDISTQVCRVKVHNSAPEIVLFLYFVLESAFFKRKLSPVKLRICA